MALAIVPESPYHSQLESLDVGKKAAARHTEQLIANISFLEGRNVEHITTSYPTSCSLVQDNTNAPATYSTVYTFFYQRSPGVKLINVELEMMANQTNSTSTVYDDSSYWLFAEFELPTSCSFISGNNLDEARFAPKILEEPWTDTSQHGLIDVSALDPDTVYKFHITGTAYDARSSAGSFNSEYIDGGFQRISVMEVPQFLLGVGTEAGFNSGSVDSVWATPYRRIVEGVRDDSGGITAGYGFVRAVDQTQQVLARWRNCWQIVNHEGSSAVDGMANVWRIPAGSSFAPIDFRVPGMTAGEQEFWIRTRNYYGSPNQVNSYRLYVRHKGTAGFLDLVYESEPSLTTGTVSVPLPASVNWTTTTLNVNLPCDVWFIDKEQLVRFWFTGDANISGPVYIATMALIENEPYPATTPV